ncbi:MAG TPA: RusA family crossover junction endodeoxyribonuclease [Kamptonema sp.]|nr:RusA family crossover junction endodeoxyribonuclease [Kamptonema sp.]
MDTNKLNKQPNSTNSFPAGVEGGIVGAKTLWLIVSSYLQVLINSAPDPMTLDELGAEIKAAYEWCQASPMAGLLYARNAGELLLEAQAKISPTEWEIWLKANCNLSARTAETYMQMAKGWPGLPKEKRKDVIQESIVPNFIVSIQEESSVGTESIEDLEDDDELELEVVESEKQVTTSELIEHYISEEEIRIPELIEEIVVSEEETEIPELIEEIIVSDRQTRIPELIDESIVSDEEIVSTELVENLEAANLSVSPEIITVNVNSLEVFEIPKSSEVEKCDREVIIFFIAGNVVPKARPRVTGNGTFMPQRYRTWRNMAELEIYSQLSELNLTIELPIKRASILMRFVGKHRTNSDLDNLAGACLDALTMNGAGVLLDDRISCVSKLSVEYVPLAEKTGVWIEITPVD